MARGFSYVEFSGFPVIGLGETWSTWSQLSMPSVVDESMSVHTEIQYLGVSQHPQYRKYHVKHEVLRVMKVRFMDEVRPTVIEIREFDLFVANDNSHLFADKDEQTSHEMLKRISNREPAFSYAHRVVDLVQMRQELNPDITGGWFKDLKIADVNTAGIFGANVSESDDWQRYEGSGVVSTLQLDFVYKEQRTKVMVTRNGVIVTFQTFSEEDTLELVRQLSDVVGAFATIVTDR